MNCSPCVILHAALACRRDTLERVTRVRRLMHRYQVHASRGVDGGFPAPAPAPTSPARTCASIDGVVEGVNVLRACRV